MSTQYSKISDEKIHFQVMILIMMVINDDDNSVYDDQAGDMKSEEECIVKLSFYVLPYIFILLGRC